MNDLWDTKYVVAVLKAFIVNILFVGSLAITYLTYAYIRNDNFTIALAIINGPIFYFNSIIFFMIFMIYFIYKAQNEF